MNTTTLAQKEKTAQMAWTGFILFFFVIQAIIWTVAISITSRDTSHAVVAGYDQEAMKWDQIQAERRKSEALGWNAVLHVDSSGDLFGNRTVTLTLKDQDGNPIEGANLQLEAFHRGRASEVQTLAVTEVGAGVYSSAVVLRHKGMWQFSGTAKRDKDQFLIKEIQYLTLEGSH